MEQTAAAQEEMKMMRNFPCVCVLLQAVSEYNRGMGKCQAHISLIQQAQSGAASNSAHSECARLIEGSVCEFSGIFGGVFCFCFQDSDNRVEFLFNFCDDS
jgi:hypothetical protein